MKPGSETPQAIASVPPVGPMTPSEVSAALAEAESLFTTKRYWDTITRVEPLVHHARGRTLARARMLLGRAYRMNPLWSHSAAAEFRRVIQLDPRNVNARLELARIYEEEGMTTRTVALLREIVAIAPHHRVALAHLQRLTRPEPGLLARFFGGEAVAATAAAS